MLHLLKYPVILYIIIISLNIFVSAHPFHDSGLDGICPTPVIMILFPGLAGLKKSFANVSKLAHCDRNRDI